MMYDGTFGVMICLFVNDTGRLSSVRVTVQLPKSLQFFKGESCNMSSITMLLPESCFKNASAYFPEVATAEDDMVLSASIVMPSPAVSLSCLAFHSLRSVAVICFVLSDICCE